MEYNIPQVWQVNKSLPTPLFKQLAENIKWSIYNGNIKPGSKLPPVQQLAKAVGVSVVTVQGAYKALEEMNLVITRPHHGTEVLDLPVSSADSEDSQDAEAFVQAIKYYLSRGLGEGEIKKLFASALDAAQNKKKILFIECHEYDKKTLARQLSDFLGTSVDFILLDQLEGASLDFSQYKAIVTTYFHYSKVLQECAQAGVPVFAVVTEFSKKTIQSISKFQPGTKVAVLCLPQHSDGYAVRVIEDIRDDLDIRSGVVTEKNRQEELIQWADVCFPNHPLENVALEVNPDIPIYFFCDQINAQSIGILKENLNALDGAEV